MPDEIDRSKTIRVNTTHQITQIYSLLCFTGDQQLFFHHMKTLKTTICAKPGSVLIFHNGVWHSPMPHNQEFDRYHMHYISLYISLYNYIVSLPWLCRSDRDATAPAFLEYTTPVRRAPMRDDDRPDAPFGGGFPAVPFDTTSES
jgi:hypothetical protein